MGLLARCLTVRPESTIGNRLFRDTPETATEHLADFHRRIGNLLRRPPRTRADDDRMLEPRTLEFDADGRRLWIMYHNEVETALRAGGTLRPILALGAKLAEHAARLAAVQEIFADPEAQVISANSVSRAITLTRHYAEEALRLHGAATVALISLWPPGYCAGGKRGPTHGSIWRQSINADRTRSTQRKKPAAW